MTIRWYINIGYENAIWQEVDSNTTFYFTGPDTTSTAQDQITPPTTDNCKWAKELWIGTSETNMSQCKLFTTPDDPIQNANILKVVFENQSTSTPPILTAFDNSSQNSISGQMFTGCEGTSFRPWLKAIETTNYTIPSQGWMNGTFATANTTTANALASTTYAVTCSSAAYENDSKSFALACAVPSDAIQGDHEWVFSVQYTYS